MFRSCPKDLDCFQIERHLLKLWPLGAASDTSALSVSMCIPMRATDSFFPPVLVHGGVASATEPWLWFLVSTTMCRGAGTIAATIRQIAAIHGHWATLLIL